MNLLENYLVEVHSIEECKEEWTKEDWAKDSKWIWVDATFNCYGSKSRHRRPYKEEDWNSIKEKGYYMG